MLALGLGVPAQTASAGAPADDEHQMLQLMNAERQRHGLAPLRLDPVLDQGAGRHAADQAARGTLYHSALAATAPAGWLRLGENVGTAGDVGQLHAALLASPPHRAAILDPGFDRVGVGIAHGAGASHWTSIKFADLPGGAPAGGGAPGLSVDTSGRVSTGSGQSFHGDLRGMRLAAPVVGIAPTPTKAGYWLVSADGGVFTFGDARFFGSAGGLRLAGPITGLTAMPDGTGYWLVSADGGVFAFGRAPFLGAVAGSRLPAPIARINRTHTGAGYALYDTQGRRYGFGDAR